MNVVILAVHAMAVVHELYARRIGSKGRAYPSGVVTVVGGLLAPALAAAVAPPTYGGGLLVPYLHGLVLLVLIHTAAKFARKGHVHRHYIGDPWFGRPGGPAGRVRPRLRPRVRLLPRLRHARRAAPDEHGVQRADPLAPGRPRPPHHRPDEGFRLRGGVLPEPPARAVTPRSLSQRPSHAEPLV